MAAIENNSISAVGVQQDLGPDGAQFVGPTLPKPSGGGAVVAANKPPVPTYSFLDGSTYTSGPNNSQVQVKPPTVVSAKSATEDLAKKQADLGIASNTMANQAANVAANNAAKSSAAESSGAVKGASQDVQDATAALQATPLSNAVKQAQQITGSSDPTAIFNYLNTRDAGMPQGTTLADITGVLNPATVKTPAQQQADVSAKQDQSYQTLTSNLLQLQNGTFPLTPDQLAQVNALQAQFDQLKQQQELANKNYTGGITNAGIAAGRNRYAPEIELGNIQSSISAGIQKIAAIDAQAAKAVSDLKQGFLDNDYKLINAAYTAASDYFGQKTKAIQDLVTNTREDAKLAIDKHTQEMADAKTEYDRQQAAIKFATDYGVTKPFYLVGNTAINTATGEKVDLPTFQRLTGQKVGLPENKTDFSQLQKDVTPPGKYTSVTKTDAFGNQVVGSFNTKTGEITYGPGSESPLPPSPATGVNTGVGPLKLSFDQYGLLANTDFNPQNTTDALAQKYLDSYIKNGTVPTASTLGRGIKPEAMAQIDQRARDLYFKATGSSLPTPEILKGYQQLIINNNKLANNLKIQEQTVKANVDLSLDNIKKHDLNSIGFKPLDNFINSINDMSNDPNVGQLIAQNTTIQNELGSLLAVKNASGTTVYDKLTSAGIITRDDTPEQIKAKVNALLTEAANFATSINTANADAYKFTDPLLQDPNNPLRVQHQKENPTTVSDYLSTHPEQLDIAKKIQTDHPDYSEADVIQALDALGSSGNRSHGVSGSWDFGVGLNREGSGSQNALALANAIKQVESGGNYNAKGASGEHGAYQFMPASWSSWAKQYLGNANAPMTSQNQDKVAEAHIQSLLDKGYTPKEVALIWNGGSPMVKKGVNSKGVKYDSGAYANKVLAKLNRV